MTIQRQYTLPNCNLIVEGLLAGDESDPTSPLTVVLNSECSFPGTSDRLSGGREFLDALVKTVSAYAQSLLSGVAYPAEETAIAAPPVTLKHLDRYRHQLVATTTEPNGDQPSTTIELNSVQLFDLVEAVDQLLADALTLPDLTLQVAPLNRRHARPAEPATKRVVPAIAGLSTLAAAAVFLFMPPVPEFEPTRVENPDLSDLVEQEAINLGESSDSPDDDSVDEDSSTADVSEDVAVSGATDAGEEDPASDDNADLEEDSDAEVETVDPVAAGIALGRLSAARPIVDDATLNAIEAELESDLADALEELTAGAGPNFDEALVYRVAVSGNVEILGYKYENDAALENVDQTPLPSLTFIPVDTESDPDEPIAQFRVTFEPEGEIDAERIEPEELDDGE
ncbi:MAG: DUF4335 domain-containing protein [Cyanobacteria bacterium P01_C01_bin.120]